MEIALRRLDGVDKISISISEQKFQITYKPGAHFEPAEIRDAVAQAGVDVVRLQIFARGRVLAEGGRHIFIAGKDKFLLVASSKTPSQMVSIEGTVDDSGEPLRLKILAFKPLN